MVERIGPKSPAIQSLISLKTYALARMLSERVGCGGRNYSHLRTNLTNCLTHLQNKYSIHFTGHDVEALITIAAAYKDAKALTNPETPTLEAGELTPQYWKFKGLQRGWIYSKGFSIEDKYLRSVFKLISYPYTNAEYDRNIAERSLGLKTLFSTRSFIDLVRQNNVRIGIAGSFARGIFGGNSDVDLCWTQHNARSIFDVKTGDYRDELYKTAKGLDVAFMLAAPKGNDGRGDIAELFGLGSTPVVWLSDNDISRFVSDPNYLQTLYQERVSR